MAAYSKAERILWDKLYDDAFEKINDNAIEQALDNTFESSGFQKLFNKNVGFHYDEDGDAAYEKDCDVYEEIEKAIEDTYRLSRHIGYTLRGLLLRRGWANRAGCGIHFKI